MTNPLPGFEYGEQEHTTDDAASLFAQPGVPEPQSHAGGSGFYGPHRGQEVLYRAPLDGTEVPYLPRFEARTILAMNSTEQVLTLRTDTGDVLLIAAGGFNRMPMPSFRQLTLKLAATSTNGGSCLVLVYEDELAPLAGNLFAGTAGSALGPFPAATLLSDTDPNPTTTRVGADLELWDEAGAKWVRARDLGAATFQKGVQKTAGTINQATATLPAVTMSGVTTLLAPTTDTGVAHRGFVLTSTSDQPFYLYIQANLGTGNGLALISGVVIPAGSIVVAFAAGGISQVSGAGTVTVIPACALAVLDLPATQLGAVVLAAGSPPTSGTITLDYTGQS